MTDLPKCPACGEDYTYMDGHIYHCPMCFHEWTDKKEESTEKALRDSVGNILEDGDSAIIAKDLRLGGSTIKQGTKVTDLRILDEEENGHDIDGKVDGFGRLNLKSSVIKKTK